jgi:NADH dehydrogenase [ubiquinone] 1 alpha subcomplex assembly factor 7
MNKKKKNLLSLDKFINKALYEEKFGYYMKKNPFGEKGDFITSPNISILFSEMIAIWIVSYWEHLNCPKKFNLIELGAGNGELMKSLISTFNQFPKFKSACKINILEKSNFLIKEQKKNISSKKIKWLKNLNELNKKPNIFIANEFFDALPIKQFTKKNGKWYETYVNVTDLKNAFYTDILFDIKKLEKEIQLKISQKQNFIEYSPDSVSYLGLITDKIKKNDGSLLLIDYGYMETKIKNTIQAVSNHKYSSVLNNIGGSDITHNINFNLFKKIIDRKGFFKSSITSQRDFLIKMGIVERAELLAKNLPFRKKVDIFYRLKRLIDKNKMGDLFKVMLIVKKNSKFRLGF